MSSTQNNNPAAKEPKNDSDTDDAEKLDDDNYQPTQEDLEAMLKYKMTKQAEAEKIRDYKKKVANTTAADFKDKPDPIQIVRVVQSFDTSLVIEWDRPCDNNSEIILYNIYISLSKEPNEMDDMYQTEAKPEEQYAEYRIPDLQANTIYYIRVLAVNGIGEGYKPTQASFARTMDDNLNEPGSLYVWGNNQSSELGLTDELVE